MNEFELKHCFEIWWVENKHDVPNVSPEELDAIRNVAFRAFVVGVETHRKNVGEVFIG